MTNLLKTTAILVCCLCISFAGKAQQNGTQDRAFWVETLTRIADPVLTNLSNNTLKKNMPYESLSKDRSDFSHLEAVGRLVCGIAPWLELGPDNTPEGQLRDKYIKLTVKGLKNAVNPDSPDYLVFGKPYQPLVDAAFLAQGLLRARTQLWDNLDPQAKEWMITEFKRSRAIKPWENNWLLFASMVEAALLEFTGECDMDRLTYGVKKFRDEWYKGDALYGDGPAFHMDYYNSFVIHPMLTDVLLTMKKHNLEGADFLDVQLPRLTRYAEQLERFISPEGTFPVVGRSIVYRFGAFHALAQASLMHVLPERVKPAQVRCAMTAVIRNQMKSPKNFDANGWLRVGFTGEQIDMSESYINTGSVYLCAVGLLSLGLPATDEYWSAMGRNFKWMMKKSLRKMPFVGKACEAAGHIFVDKSGPKKVIETIEHARHVLQDGTSLVVFPEGARTFTGHMGYFKKGAFQLADDLQLPVVPLTIIGSFNILPRTGGFVSWHPMTLVVHKPIYPQSQGMENIKATMEEAYREIEKDLPEKYQGKIDNPDQDR